LNSSESLSEFLREHNITWDKNSGKWSKQFYPKTTKTWMHDPKGSINIKTGERGYWKTDFIKWQLGKNTNKVYHCIYCLQEIEDPIEFCSQSCKSKLAELYEITQKLSKFTSLLKSKKQQNI
jgi:predicted nucleic acid-binding Zn ribbon protein